MRLSSSTTFFWKYVFIGVWISALIGAVAQTIGRAESIFELKTLLAFVFFSLVIAFSVWILGSLKSVSLDGNSLIISNYFRKISVPLDQIAVVNDPDMSSHRRILVSFVSPTVFGEEIVFMPPLFKAQVTANLLQDRIDSSQT